MKLKTLIHFTFLLAAAGLTSNVYAAEMASATLTSTEVDPTTWLYSITLDDIGTTNVGTFWFSWIPGEDFMDSAPSDIVAPAGWTDSVTHAVATDGYAVRWVAGAGDAITPGNSLSGFSFESSVSPAALAGNSPFYTSRPELTSFVYSAGPFSDSGFQFQAQEAATTNATPEPATWGFAWIGAIGLYIRRAYRSRA